MTTTRQSASPAVQFYCQHSRAADALRLARCFPKKSDRTMAAASFLSSHELGELVQRLARFNLFEALGVTEREIRHSRFLYWLLDQRAAHGKGLERFRALLKLAGRKFSDRLQPDEIEVLCERDLIDLRLVDHANHFVLAFENKLYGSERKNQLDETIRRIRALYPRYSHGFVYLTLNHEAASHPLYQSLSFDLLLRTVLGRRDVPSDFAAARALLFANYAATIRRRGQEGTEVNALDLLHLGKTELRHSDFIAYLLGPNRSHGLGDAFVRYVLQILSRRGARLPADLDSIGLQDLTVHREQDRIDIVAISESSRFVLVIENKLAAREHGAQLSNYRQAIARRFDRDTAIFVYLDLKNTPPSDPRYLPLSYDDLLPFFDARSTEAEKLDDAERARIIENHYAHLTGDLLFIRRKQTWTVPASVQTLCEGMAAKYPQEGGALIAEIRRWQTDYWQRLEPFLYELADRFFGPCLLKKTHKVWFTFVPEAFRKIPVLRVWGANPWVGNWLVYYQFFVVPFGDSISVRKPGIKLDIKIAEAKPTHTQAKAALCQWAMADKLLFNRAQSGVRRDHPIISYRLGSFDEAMACREGEFRRRIEHRLERFARGYHPEIVDFFARGTDALLKGEEITPVEPAI